jgi:hypothetical protein
VFSNDRTYINICELNTSTYLWCVATFGDRACLGRVASLGDIARLRLIATFACGRLGKATGTTGATRATPPPAARAATAPAAELRKHVPSTDSTTNHPRSAATALAHQLRGWTNINI